MKGIKKTGNFIKQYFVFNRTERKGIYALLVLIALSLAIPRLWVIIFPPEPLVFSITNLPEETTITPIDSTTQVVKDENESKGLFSFNPNKADSETFIQLGFSPKIAGSIIHYRDKGGWFRKAEDMYRIYHVDSHFIARLIPYIQIDEANLITKNKFENNISSTERNAFVPVEINTADSVSLVKLYGIGPKLASKIIDFRTRSGGFFALKQLTEIYGIDEDLLDELKGKIHVDETVVRYININTVTFEELKKHPYLRYKTANAIINYRMQHGPFKQTEDLKKIIILPDSIYNKLLPYIKLSD